MKKIGVIIPAAGTGSRMGSGGVPKQFLMLGGGPDGDSPADEGKRGVTATVNNPAASDDEGSYRAPVLAWSVKAFRGVAPEADIVVALPAEYIEMWAEMCRLYNVPPHKVCEGGATRFLSVRAAMARLDPECTFIAVHDAARPLVSAELILRTLETARGHGSAIPAVGLVDTIRHLTEGSSYIEDRTALRAVQTPQTFRADILRTAYERAVSEEFTDDAGVVESVGYNLMLCEGERRNFKITTPEDLVMAGALARESGYDS